MDFKVVLIGGSFNPPTYSHLEMGKFLLKSGFYDKIIFVPCGFRKDKKNFASDELRKEMLIIGITQYFNQKPYLINSGRMEKIEDLNSIKPEILIDLYEIEDNEEMVPTALILQMYQEKFLNINVFFTIGSDLLSSLKTWDFYEEILKFQNFIIFERQDYNIEDYEIPPYSILVYDEIPKHISSTKIRDIIIKFKIEDAIIELRKFTVSDVVNFIFEHKLYINHID